MEMLKPKETLFCYHYARLRNGEEAAVRAGFAQNSANSVSDKLLNRQAVIDKIDSYSNKSKQDALMQCAIAGLKRLAFSNSNDGVQLLFCSKDDALKKIETLDLFHVSEIRIPRENAVEIKFFDRFKALEKLVEIAGVLESPQSSSSFYDALDASAAHQLGDDDGV